MLCLVVVLLQAAPAAPIKLAAPGLATVNVTPELQTFVADHLNQQLVLAGVSVLSSSQVAAVLGLERQKQLLGCSGATDCVAEFADALGVDGLVLGNLARLGTRLQLDVRVAATSDARSLATFSTSVADDAGLPEAIAKAAEAIATQLATALNRELKPVVQPTESRWSTTRKVGMGTTFAGTAVALAGFGVLLAGPTAVDAPNYWTFAYSGTSMLLVGAVAMLAGGAMWIFGGSVQAPVSAALLPTRDGFSVALSGSF